MDKLQQLIQQLQEKINALSLRERGILFLAISFILYSAVDYLLLSPLGLQQQGQLKQIHSIQAENSQLESQALNIINRFSIDPDQAKKQQLAQLKRTLETTSSRIEDAVAGLIPPEKMPMALENLLQHQKGLKFIAIDNLPAEPLITNEKDNKDQSTPADITTPTQGIYRHSFRLQFEGSYLDTLAYLRELEALKWSFRWDEIDLTMLKYPTARISIVIHTISLDEEVIGV
ncbi:MAG: hypothetical protein OEL79_09090 [Chromatiales bacterium]|nr:hypothetical protein [Chromatiales bacterium]